MASLWSLIDQLYRKIASSLRPEEVQEDLRHAAEGDEDGLYEKAGMYGVMVISQRDEHVCEACLDHDGIQYTMQEKQEKHPIPHEACTNEECRCSYLPIPDRETYEDMLNEEPDLSNLYD